MRSCGSVSRSLCTQRFCLKRFCRKRSRHWAKGEVGAALLVGGSDTQCAAWSSVILVSSCHDGSEGDGITRSQLWAHDRLSAAGLRLPRQPTARSRISPAIAGRQQVNAGFCAFTLTFLSKDRIWHPARAAEGPRRTRHGRHGGLRTLLRVGPASRHESFQDTGRLRAGRPFLPHLP